MGISTWRLRTSVSNARTEVSNAQIKRFEEWGLLTRNEDSSWPEETVDRLREILREAKENKLIRRRVIRLRREASRFPIATSILRKVLAEFAQNPRSIELHKLKMILIDHAKAIEAFDERNLTPGLGEVIILKARVNRPSRHKWNGIVEDPRIDDQRFEAIASKAYGWAMTLEYLEEGPQLLGRKFPLEERVLMLIVRDMSRRLAWITDWKDSEDTKVQLEPVRIIEP